MSGLWNSLRGHNFYLLGTLSGIGYTRVHGKVISKMLIKWRHCDATRGRREWRSRVTYVVTWPSHVSRDANFESRAARRELIGTCMCRVHSRDFSFYFCLVSGLYQWRNARERREGRPRVNGGRAAGQGWTCGPNHNQEHYATDL